MLYWRWTDLFARECEENALLHLPSLFSLLSLEPSGNPTHYQTAPVHSTAHDQPCEDVFQQDTVEHHHGFFWSKAGSQHGLQAAAKTWLGFQKNIDKEWKHVMTQKHQTVKMQQNIKVNLLSCSISFRFYVKRAENKNLLHSRKKLFKIDLWLRTLGKRFVDTTQQKWSSVQLLPGRFICLPSVHLLALGLHWNRFMLVLEGKHVTSWWKLRERIQTASLILLS